MVSASSTRSVAADAKVMPTTTDVWAGRLKHANVAWEQAAQKITVSQGTVTVLDASSCRPSRRT
jgi:uncharacterized heparinase superfamily protein